MRPVWLEQITEGRVEKRRSEVKTGGAVDHIRFFTLREMEEVMA